MPSAAHRDEERKRLELTREDVGEGSPYRGPIDLDGGQVRFKTANGHLAEAPTIDHPTDGSDAADADAPADGPRPDA